MEPKGSSPHSQVPATCPYPKPNRFSPCFPISLLKINFNITLPSTSRSSKWSLSLKSPHQTLCAPFCLPYVLHTSMPPSGIRTHNPSERPQTYALHRTSTGVGPKWNDVWVKWPSFPLLKFAGSVYLVVQGQSLSNEVERHQVER